MRLLLITLGSHGDIHPFFAIAQAMRAAGHEAIVATNPYFQDQANRAGIPFAALSDRVDVAEIMQHPGVMHASKGPRVVLKELTLPLVPEFFARTTRLIQDIRPDAAIIHPIVLGSHWACEKAGVPIITATLAPIGWMRAKDKIVFGQWRTHDPRLYATRFDAWIGRHIVRWMLDPPLNRIRADLGLPRLRDILISEFMRPGLNLGLWSSHFRPPAPGDPPGSVITGFPFFDTHHDHHDDDPALERFLSDGDPPIVFAQGTTAVHIRSRFYDCAIQAAAALNRRAVLLVGRSEYRSRLPTLPPTVYAATYAPFSSLLPRACATVHHGGIGSTAQGLRSGRPTVITPLAHDQFDNAARAKRLGVSETLFHSRLSPRALTSALARVLENPGTAARAHALSKAVLSEHPTTEIPRLIAEWPERAKGLNSQGAH